MNPIERYLTDIAEIRGTRSNVAETSFYPALDHLLSTLGKTLSPRVRCVTNLANRGAGIPDGELFTADQFRRAELPASFRDLDLATVKILLVLIVNENKPDWLTPLR